MEDRASDAVSAVLERLSSLSAGQLVLACIEGLGGAGKSTLAEAVAAARTGDVVLVHGDEFYGPEEGDWRSWSPEQGYERYFDHERLERDLLRPLRSSLPAHFQRYDWADNVLDGWTTVEPSGIVLVEGVYLLRPRLRAFWDLSIYVDAPRDIRQSRLQARGENDADWIARWAAAEDFYERRDHPAAAADIVVRGY